MGASPGPRSAANVLRLTSEIAPFFGMDVKATVSIPTFHEHFDFERGEVTSKECVTEITNALNSLTVREVAHV